VNVKRWKDKYIYTNMHETFFIEFPCFLYEWMKRKIATNSALWPLDPLVWDQVILYRLKALDNKWNKAIDLLFTQVKEGYIIEFPMEYSDSFSEAERKFAKGMRKQMLEEIPL
jgi:hypothetical protein